MSLPPDLEAAQRLVSAYGQVLASLDGSGWAHPRSLLPAPPDQIMAAIHRLLAFLADADSAVCQSLAQSYVYLAQFVDDEEAETVRRGQAALGAQPPDPSELPHADEAARIINRIKLEMENLVQDVQIYLR